MDKLEFIYNVESIDSEDGGSAKIADLWNDDPDDDRSIFVRLQSWEEKPTRKGAHPEIAALENKRIKITIEVLGDVEKTTDDYPGCYINVVGLRDFDVLRFDEETEEFYFCGKAIGKLGKIDLSTEIAKFGLEYFPKNADVLKEYVYVGVRDSDDNLTPDSDEWKRVSRIFTDLGMTKRIFAHSVFVEEFKEK